MNQEEQDLVDYQRARRQLEEDMDELKSVRRKGEQLTEATFSDMQRMLQRFGENNEPMVFARRELARLEEAFFSELDHEKRKLALKEDEAEQAYRKKVSERN